MSQQEQGEIAGTRDRHFDLLWFTQACLDNVLRLQTYAQDAERDGDQELADFFRKAQGDSQRAPIKGRSCCGPGLPSRVPRATSPHT